jgi:hypothetical protein
MRLVLNKKFKDEDEGGNSSSFVKEEQKILDEMQEEIKGEANIEVSRKGRQQGHKDNSNYINGRDSDIKILESDYSNSTFHLASRSSVIGTAKSGNRTRT